MKETLIFILLVLMVGCTTYSVTMVHSTGQASDVVDETQTQSPSTSITATTTLPTAL